MFKCWTTDNILHNKDSILNKETKLCNWKRESTAEWLHVEKECFDYNRTRLSLIRVWNYYLNVDGFQIQR